jgi:DNA-binding response OmpR family regulator
MTKRVLLVDDEPHVTRVMRLALERAGFIVDQAGNGQVALDKMAVSMPDIVISDLEMPVMNGRVLCERILAEYSDTGVRLFVLTSRAEVEFREWAGGVEGLEFLEKPVSLRRLVCRLEALECERPMEGAGIDE